MYFWISRTVGILVLLAIFLVAGQYLYGMYKTGPDINSNLDFVINRNLKSDLAKEGNNNNNDTKEITVTYPNLWPIQCFAAASVVKAHAAGQNIINSNCNDLLPNNSIVVNITFTKLEPM